VVAGFTEDSDGDSDFLIARLTKDGDIPGTCDYLGSLTLRTTDTTLTLVDTNATATDVTSNAGVSIDEKDPTPSIIGFCPK
jgi:hypothetical protein